MIIENFPYDGEVDKDGEKHGFGSFIYNDGSVYDGEWLHGKRNGQGELRCPSDENYDVGGRMTFITDMAA